MCIYIYIYICIRLYIVITILVIMLLMLLINMLTLKHPRHPLCQSDGLLGFGLEAAQNVARRLLDVPADVALR